MLQDLQLLAFDHGKTLLTSGFTILLGIILIRLLMRGLDQAASHNILPMPSIKVLKSVARWLIIMLVMVMVLEQIGLSQSLWAMASTVLAMVAIGFVAGWSIISNFFATFLLLIFQPFRIGDEIQILDPSSEIGQQGKVVDFTLIFTILDQVDPKTGNEYVVQIPNNMFFQKVIRCKRGTKTMPLKEQLFQESATPPTVNNDPTP